MEGWWAEAGIRLTDSHCAHTHTYTHVHNHTYNMFTLTYTNTHPCTQVHTIFTHLGTRANTRTHAYLHILTHAHIHTLAHNHVHTSTHAGLRSHTRFLIHTHAHTNTHTEAAYRIARWQYRPPVLEAPRSKHFESPGYRSDSSWMTSCRQYEGLAPVSHCICSTYPLATSGCARTRAESGPCPAPLHSRPEWRLHRPAHGVPNSLAAEVGPE